MSHVVIVGSVALDTIETPHGKRDEVLGGSATMFALSASHFAPVQLVSIVGNDFPDTYLTLLKNQGIDLDGLQVVEGKTFRWHGKYSASMSERETISVALNVLEQFDPQLPSHYTESPYLFLGNGSPATQLSVLAQMKHPRFVMMDTMNLWIEHNRKELETLIAKVDGLCINEEEAKMLSGSHDLNTAAQQIFDMGANILIIKEAEKGATLYTKETTFHVPAFETAQAVDPTGAGDYFAGGLMGYVASQEKTDIETLKNGLVYGNIMGSINVEGFGTESLDQTSKELIAHRYTTLTTHKTEPNP